MTADNHAAPGPLSFSLCDPNAVLTKEQREARDEALRLLAEARRKGPTTTERVT